MSPRCPPAPLDAAGYIYVAGHTDIAGLATRQAHKPQPGFASQDGYLIKLGPAGERIWGTYFGGPEPETLHDLAVDGDRVVFCGYTASDDVARGGRCGVAPARRQ